MELTKEQQVAQDYKAALDSVNLLKAGKPADMKEEEWAEVVSRNKEHLKIQLAKADMYAGYDLAPLQSAAA